MFGRNKKFHYKTFVSCSELILLYRIFLIFYISSFIQCGYKFLFDLFIILAADCSLNDAMKTCLLFWQNNTGNYFFFVKIQCFRRGGRYISQRNNCFAFMKESKQFYANTFLYTLYGYLSSDSSPGPWHNYQI